ncbi:MAG TPA: M23 family metallopeptidase [Solirubrobacteraceae bacterium]
MKPLPRGLIVSLLGTLLLSAPAPVAIAAGAGGVSADPGQVQASHHAAGGAQFGATIRHLPGRVLLRRAQLAGMHVREGHSPLLIVRVTRDYAQSARLLVRISARGARTRTLDLGRVRTGARVALRLPARARLLPGSYVLRVIAAGGAGQPVAVSAALRVVVRARPAPTARPKPRTPAAPTPSAPATPPPVPKILGGTGSSSGVFPVQGPYSFGGADGRFGAGRVGHLHEGQDILAVQGTPVVAPVPGSVLFNDYQHGGAGRYVVLHADDGRDMFFAHCEAGSANVSPGRHLAAGERICLVGATGDATGPHLHFELWPDGWRQVKGTRPIDPLPQLRAWAG